MSYKLFFMDYLTMQVVVSTNEKEILLILAIRVLLKKLEKNVLARVTWRYVANIQKYTY